MRGLDNRDRVLPMIYEVLNRDVSTIRPIIWSSDPKMLAMQKERYQDVKDLFQQKV